MLQSGDGRKQVSMKHKRAKLLTPFGLALLAFSLIYIGAEALFNMRLVDIAGSVKSNPDEIRDLQHFGRAVSGYGFALLTLGAFAGSGFRFKERKYWVLFVALTAVSLIPFLFKFSEALFGVIKGVSHELHAEPWDLQLALLPFMGI